MPKRFLTNGKTERMAHTHKSDKEMSNIWVHVGWQHSFTLNENAPMNWLNVNNLLRMKGSEGTYIDRTDLVLFAIVAAILLQAECAEQCGDSMNSSSCVYKGLLIHYTMQVFCRGLWFQHECDIENAEWKKIESTKKEDAISCLNKCISRLVSIAGIEG